MADSDLSTSPSPVRAQPRLDPDVDEAALAEGEGERAGPAEPGGRPPKGPRPDSLTSNLFGGRAGAELAGEELRREDRLAVHRLRDLSRRHRILFGVLVAVAVLPALFAGLSAYGDDWIPSGDNALIALRADDVFTSRTPLVGQPSTSEQYGSSSASHPGPMEFWLLAIPLQVLGPSLGLLMGTVLINGTAIALTAYVAFRRQGLLFAGWVVLGVLVMATSLGVNFLIDPISSNVATFSVVLLVFLVWSLILGDLALLPLAAVVTSFVLQNHLSVLSHNAGFLVFGAVVFGISIWLQRKRLPQDRWRSFRSRLVRWLGWTGLAVAVLWSPVVIDQLVRSGNVSAIFTALTEDAGEGKGMGWAVDRMLTALGPQPIFARSIPRSNLEYLKEPTGVSAVTAALPLIAAVVLAVFTWVRHRKAAFWLLVTALAALASGAYSAARLPAEGAAEQKASALRWMWTGGLIVWLALGWGAWSLLRRRSRLRYGPWLAAGLAGAVLLASVATVGSYDPDDDRDRPYMAGLQEALPTLRNQLEPGAPYRLLFLGQQGGFVGPAFAYDLSSRGYQIYGQPFLEDALGSSRTYEGQKIAGDIYILDGPLEPPTPEANLVDVVQAETVEVERQLGALYDEINAAFESSGGVRLTPAGRDLRDNPPEDSPEDRVIAALLADPDALIRTGVVSSAIADGLVENPGFSPSTLANFEAQVSATKPTPYISVWTAPPPSSAP